MRRFLFSDSVSALISISLFSPFYPAPCYQNILNEVKRDDLHTREWKKEKKDTWNGLLSGYKIHPLFTGLIVLQCAQHPGLPWNVFLLCVCVCTHRHIYIVTEHCGQGADPCRPGFKAGSGDWSLHFIYSVDTRHLNASVLCSRPDPMAIQWDFVCCPIEISFRENNMVR